VKHGRSNNGRDGEGTEEEMESDQQPQPLHVGSPPTSAVVAPM